MEFPMPVFALGLHCISMHSAALAGLSPRAPGIAEIQVFHCLQSLQNMKKKSRSRHHKVDQKEDGNQFHLLLLVVFKGGLALFLYQTKRMTSLVEGDLCSSVIKTRLTE